MRMYFMLGGILHGFETDREDSMVSSGEETGESSILVLITVCKRPI